MSTLFCNERAARTVGTRHFLPWSPIYDGTRQQYVEKNFREDQDELNDAFHFCEKGTIRLTVLLAACKWWLLSTVTAVKLLNSGYLQCELRSLHDNCQNRTFAPTSPNLNR